MYLELLSEELQAEAEQAEQAEEQGQGRRQRVNGLGDLSGTPFKVTKVS